MLYAGRNYRCMLEAILKCYIKYGKYGGGAREKNNTTKFEYAIKY
jgi:hypothetical protein